jgi:hypothetical protein
MFDELVEHNIICNNSSSSHSTHLTSFMDGNCAVSQKTNPSQKQNITWWRSVGVGWVLVEVGGVEVVLDLRRDRGVDGPVAEALPVEAVEPPETNEMLVSSVFWEMARPLVSW